MKRGFFRERKLNKKGLTNTQWIILIIVIILLVVFIIAVNYSSSIENIFIGKGELGTGGFLRTSTKCPSSEPKSIKVKCDLEVAGASLDVEPGYCEEGKNQHVGYITAIQCNYFDPKNDCLSKGYSYPMEISIDNTCSTSGERIELDPSIEVTGNTEQECRINGNNDAIELCKEEPIPEKSITCCTH